jgi:hypothetical protein
LALLLLLFLFGLPWLGLRPWLLLLLLLLLLFGDAVCLFCFLKKHASFHAGSALPSMLPIWRALR